MSVRTNKERFSTLETVKILLNHSPIMEKAIYKMDRSGERFISEADLGGIIHEYKKLLKPTEIARIEIAFSLQNLLDTTVLIDKSSMGGVTRYVFQESVIGLFRLCNSSLFQELTDSKLKSFLAALWRLETVLSDRQLTPYGSDDFKESVDDLFEQLAVLLDALRRNVNRMRGVGVELESMTAKASKGDKAFASMRGEYLGKITHLFERHIQPTQTFLNPKTRIENGLNLFDVLKNFGFIFEAHGMDSEADQIFKYYLSFSNIFKPIDKVATDVGKFIYKTRHAVAEYNAFETAYQKLVASFGKTLSADLRKNKLGREFIDKEFAYGLKKHGRPQVNSISDSPSYTRAVVDEIEMWVEDSLVVKTYQDDVDTVNWRDDATASRVDRVELIKNILIDLRVRDTSDLALELHNRIKHLLPEYSLVDLFSAIRIYESEYLKAVAEVVKVNIFNELIYNDYRYNYRITKSKVL